MSDQPTNTTVANPDSMRIENAEEIDHITSGDSSSDVPEILIISAVALVIVGLAMAGFVYWKKSKQQKAAADRENQY